MILAVGEAPDYAFPHSAEFYQLSQAALALPKVEAGALTPEQATALIDRPGDDDFLACGFVHIGVWGRRPPAEWASAAT
jgi:hypothetical protein